jgi:hypothetical protein
MSSGNYMIQISSTQAKSVLVLSSFYPVFYPAGYPRIAKG